MISSHDEWSPLKKIVVGSATDANWPVNDPVFSKEAEKTTWKETPVPRGPVPQRIIDETNEDLDDLASTLISLGVEVVRPEPLNFQAHDGLYNYCPRDRLLVFGDTVIDTSMMYPCRDMELQCYHDILKDANVIHMPRDKGLVLDAANILRLGPNKMLYLESASGNKAAYYWLLANLPPDTSIELCNFYAGVHIDSTIVPLRNGLVMLNASRVNFNNVPRAFDGWQKIWVNDVVAQGFYQYPYASKWIAMNMLVVDPNTVICDADQTELIKTLKSYKFEVIPKKLRHSRTLGGGFHCVTLDLCRNGSKIC
jgi:glycine amidinotransferase/scyllo-inosamine-4-phosphate amidinotransferase 1